MGSHKMGPERTAVMAKAKSKKLRRDARKRHTQREKDAKAPFTTKMQTAAQDAMDKVERAVKATAQKMKGLVTLGQQRLLHEVQVKS